MLAASYLVLQACISFFEVIQTKVAHVCLCLVRINMQLLMWRCGTVGCDFPEPSSQTLVIFPCDVHLSAILMLRWSFVASGLGSMDEPNSQKVSCLLHPEQGDNLFCMIWHQQSSSRFGMPIRL